MKTFLALIVSFFLILSFANCKRYDDTVLTVKVKSYADSSGVPGLPVVVLKKRLKITGSMSSYTKIVDTFEGVTDKNGVASVRVENYNHDKYWFDVEVNGNRCNGGGGNCLFPTFNERLEHNELNQVLEFLGTPILMPDPLPQGP